MVRSPLQAARWRALVALTVLSVLPGCRRPAPHVLRVGLLAVTGGDMAIASGTPSVEGAMLAVDEINAAGGVKVGSSLYRLALVRGEYENRSDAAAVAARQLINLDSVHVLVGPQISAHALLAAPIAEASQVPMISPMSSNPAVTEGRQFVTRLAFRDGFQGEVLARYARQTLKLERAVALHDEASAYGRGLVALFGEAFRAAGGELVGTETYASDGGHDFTPQLRRLLARRPDALLLPNYSDADSFQVRQARSLGYRGQILGSDTWDPVSMGKVPEAAGTILISQWNSASPNPRSIAFVKAFMGRFGHRPRTTAVATYDAIRILADAVSEAGTLDGASIAVAVRRARAVDGAAATYRFDGSGDPRRGGAVSRLTVAGDSLVMLQEPPG